MTVIPLVARPRAPHWTVHAEVLGTTLCGWPCTDWITLEREGSLYSVTCQNCIRVLRAAGDLPSKGST